MKSQPNPVALGIDVGGTKIAAGLVDRRGHVLMRKQIPTNPTRGGEAVLLDVILLAHTWYLPDAVFTNPATRDRSTLPIGIGLSICELVDPHGNVTSGYTVKWQGLPVQERMSQIAPTIVEADVRAHALAEATFGAGKPYGDFVFLNVGTGLSSCLVQNGKPYAGANGNALVLASMPVTVFAESGKRVEFLLEPFASGAGLVDRYNRLRGTTITRVEQIVAAAQLGDDGAAQILTTGGEALGSAVGWLLNVLDPPALIVGGGLGLADGLYWESFVASTRRHIYADATRTLPILRAACGADAGIIGAAARVLKSE